MNDSLEPKLELETLKAQKARTPAEHRELVDRITFIGTLLTLMEEQED
ncbi:hypothetical protein [Endozoicomonas lisbonensis]